ncbi:MAG: disulfide bond formation protein B [Reyranellaceae bacterium]
MALLDRHPLPGALDRILLPSQLGLIAAIGSIVLLGGAYFFQYVMGLAPCEMCLWQRWPHMAVIAAGLAAFACYKTPRLAGILLLVAIAGLATTSALGLFHAGVELRWWQGPQACSGTIPTGLSPEELRKYLFATKMVRCDAVAWSLFGISMAGWNAILSALLAIGLASGAARWMKARS